MALTNPKYARQAPMGGFNAAGADMTGGLFTIPRDVAAEAAGAALGEQTYTNAPTEAVSKSFSASMSASGGGPDTVIPPIPKDEALPAPISSNEISKAFAPLMAEIQGQKGPKGRPVPPPTPALATFLSVLAGSLGAQLTKDPRVEESVIQTLTSHEEQRQAIQNQNYAQDLLFNQQKANQRLAAMGQQLEADLAAATSAKDTERMMKVNQNLEKLKGFMQGRTEMIRGNEDRKTARVTAAMKAKEGELAATLEPKDYAARRGELITSKEVPADKGGMFFGWGQTHPKREELAQLDKEALHSGNEKTIVAAKRNIQQAVLKDLGFANKAKYTKLESKAIVDSLRRIYDLSPDEVGF